MFFQILELNSNMGKVPKKKTKVLTPGSFPKRRSQGKATKNGGQKNGTQKNKRKSGGSGGSDGRGRPAQKRKGTSRKDNYRYGTTIHTVITSFPTPLK
jgi:hypothetical protein